MQSGGFSSAANKHTTDFKISDYPPVLCLELVGSIVPRDSCVAQQAISVYMKRDKNLFNHNNSL